MSLQVKHVILHLLFLVGSTYCSTPEISLGDEATDFMCNHHGVLKRQYSDERELCIVVRTYPRQPFEGLLFSLLNQRGVNASDWVRLFVVNTDGTPEGAANVTTRIATWRDHYGAPRTVCSFNTHHVEASKEGFGYFQTDTVLDVLTNVVPGDDPPCRYVMITNGDNAYSSNLLHSTLHHMDGNTTLIAWDFVTHHPRQGADGQKVTSQMIPVQLKRRYLDLGSFMLDYRVYQQGHRFIENGQAAFAADWFLVQRVMTEMKEDFNVKFVHGILMLHQ